MKIIVRTLHGLEPVLAKELEELGCTDIELLTRAVLCEATEKQIYQGNLLLRSAIKIMYPILETQVNDEYDLYDAVKSIEWESYFKLNQTFSIESVTNSDIFRHSQYAGLKSKDAIADRFREKYDKRPFVNPITADFPIIIHIRQDILTILLDTTGASLHQRGYRIYPVEAPLNEVLAAGMILHSGWDKISEFSDPMCGSGTLLIEAASIAAYLPAQTFDRKYAFMNWQTFNAALWKEVVEEAKAKINLELIPPIIGADKSMQAVKAAETNIQEAGLSKHIKVNRLDFFNTKGQSNKFIIMNPPYDERLKEDDIIKFYQNIGTKLKHEYVDTTAWIIGGNIEALKMIGLKPSKKISLLNGDIDAGFHKFEIYEGSKKIKE
jgi:putative N6-adenine-specific DNA methylase